MQKSELLDKDWLLTSMNDKKINLHFYNKKPFIKFKEDDRYFAYAGCNQISGGFGYTAPNGITFLPNAIMTKMACDTPKNIENEFVETLQEVKFCDIKEQVLVFTDIDNKIILTFE